MSPLPRELIMVGMRYQPAYKVGSIKSGDILVIKREPDNAVNKDAIAVHSPKEGMLLGKETRVGYIRDADLHLCRTFNFLDHGRYKVNRVCTNYLYLEFVSHEFYVISSNKSANEENKYFYSSGDYWTSENPNKFTVSNGTTANRIISTNSTNWPEITGTTVPNVCITNSQDKIKEKKMINTNSMRDNFFKEVKNVALDMQTGKLGISTKEGIVVYTDDGVSVNPITEMGFTIPAFAMRVPVDQLTKGDIIVGSGDPVFFREGSKAGYLTVTTSGVYQETGVVANMFFGKNTVMAVKNMFGDSGTNGMNPLMLMMMMGDDKSGSEGFDFKKMMMMQMMMGNQGGSEGMNPMMMAMMMSKM